MIACEWRVSTFEFPSPLSSAQRKGEEVRAKGGVSSQPKQQSSERESSGGVKAEQSRQDQEAERWQSPARASHSKVLTRSLALSHSHVRGAFLQLNSTDDNNGLVARDSKKLSQACAALPQLPKRQQALSSGTAEQATSAEKGSSRLEQQTLEIRGRLSLDHW